jgi:hypothetical protein
MNQPSWRRSLATAVFLVIGLSAPPAGSSPAPERLLLGYVGKTSQHQDIGFRVKRTPEGSTVWVARFLFKVTCEGSGETHKVSYVIGLGFAPIEEGSFSFTGGDPSGDYFFRWSGRISPKQAAGVVEYSFPEEPREEPRCETGELTWRAHLIGSGGPGSDYAGWPDSN